MSYRIVDSAVDGNRYLRMESNPGGEYAVILPEYGGSVHQLALHEKEDEKADESRRAPGNVEAKKLLENDSAEEIRQNPWFRGRILFPFDDRVYKGQYTFEGQSYQLPINDPEGQDALHGFLHSQSLKCSSHEGGKNRARVVLEGDIADKPGYPFHLHIKVEYILDADGFHLDIKIHNQGNGSAPFSVGWHPYFTLFTDPAEPIRPPGPNVDDLQLLLPSEGYIETNEKQLPSGLVLPVKNTELDFRNSRAIGQMQLDHGFVNKEGYMELCNGNTLLRILQSELFSYSQVFIPPHRSSVALEPISAGTDAFNFSQLGLRVLSPGESVRGTISVLLSRVR